MALKDKNLEVLFNNNLAWADRIRAQHPDFFEQLAKQQNPQFLWIGCSDSRVPANEIVGLMPGEVFVHRNIANVVVHSDLNCLSVIQFAVDVLKVQHIMVVGHYGCGGVRAALFDQRVGLADNWLHHVHDVRDKHMEALKAIGLNEGRLPPRRRARAPRRRDRSRTRRRATHRVSAGAARPSDATGHRPGP